MSYRLIANGKNVIAIYELVGFFKIHMLFGWFTFNSKLSMLRCLYEFKSLELCLRNNCAVFAMIYFQVNSAFCAVLWLLLLLFWLVFFFGYCGYEYFRYVEINLKM